MDLDDVRMRLIRAALSKRVIDVTEIINDQEFLVRVDYMAKKFFANADEGDARTFDQVYESTLSGEIGEYALAQCAISSGLEVEHNDEEVTGEFHWDLRIEGMYCEVKLQGDGTDELSRTFFSFSNQHKDKTMRQKWQSLNLVLAFYLKNVNDKLCVIPWMLIDNKAFDPVNEVYVPSHKGSGYFLKMNIAQNLNLFTRLNTTPGEFQH